MSVKCFLCDCEMDDEEFLIGDGFLDEDGVTMLYRHEYPMNCVDALLARAEAAEAEVAALRAQQAAQWQQTNGTPPAEEVEIKFLATTEKKGGSNYLLLNSTTESEYIWWGDPGIMHRPVPPQETATPETQASNWRTFDVKPEHAQVVEIMALLTAVYYADDDYFAPYDTGGWESWRPQENSQTS